MAKQKLLITGSAGFVCNILARKIIYNKLNYEVVSIDKVTDPKGLNNIYLNKNHNFYLGDVADAHFVEMVFQLEQPDLVIHGAAETSTASALANPIPFIHSNVLGTQTIIDACIKHKVQKLIYISTDEVLGSLARDEKPWSETTAINPLNPSAATKASAEHLIRAAHQTQGLQYNITRCVNNFGPRQVSKYLVPMIIKNVLNNTPITLHGQGQHIREWISVDDHCIGILATLAAPANEIYHISTGWELSTLEMAQEICNLIGRGHELITFIPDRPGNNTRYSLDSTKLRGLGWKPTVKFKEALQNTIDWYQINQWILK